VTADSRRDHDPLRAIINDPTFPIKPIVHSVTPAVPRFVGFILPAPGARLCSENMHDITPIVFPPICRVLLPEVANVPSLMYLSAFGTTNSAEEATRQG